MHFNKLFTTILSSFSIFSCFTTTCSFAQQYNQVIFDFSEPDNYSVTCNGNTKLFDNITSFSNEINDITSNYFTVGSINIDTEHLNTIVFNNINLTNDFCTLHLRGSNNFKPNILFKNGMVRVYTIVSSNLNSLVFTNTIFTLVYL